MDKFSLWCDFVERDFLKGQFLRLIDSNINGATSNPSIFKDAILSSKAYQDHKNKFKHKSKKELYEILATYDIKMAANTLLKNYANNNDGFVSIEVDPNLNTAKDIIKEGKRLFNTIKMPNVMIKIPAVDFAYEAMSELIKCGISVNATLIFTKSQAKKCLDAFEIGFNKFNKKFENLRAPNAVISIFVSRFDRVLESKLKDTKFANKVGIMNATKIYKAIQKKKFAKY